MSKTIIHGGVHEYIKKCPIEIQKKLKRIQTAILEIAPDSIETTSYFQIPGYSCGENLYYNGMFVWFSFKQPFIRLHVIPPAIHDHEKELEIYATTDSVVNFPMEREIPIALVKKLTRASLEIMKEKSKKL